MVKTGRHGEVNGSSDLGCNVIRCPAKGRRQVIGTKVGAAHAHIGQSDVAFGIQHDVIKFQVSEYIQIKATRFFHACY